MYAIRSYYASYIGMIAPPGYPKMRLTPSCNNDCITASEPVIRLLFPCLISISLSSLIVVSMLLQIILVNKSYRAFVSRANNTCISLKRFRNITFTILSRITSYNVCYTKLLRVGFVIANKLFLLCFHLIYL